MVTQFRVCQCQPLRPKYMHNFSFVNPLIVTTNLLQLQCISITNSAHWTLDSLREQSSIELPNPMAHSSQSEWAIFRLRWSNLTFWWSNLPFPMEQSSKSYEENVLVRRSNLSNSAKKSSDYDGTPFRIRQRNLLIPMEQFSEFNEQTSDSNGTII